MADADVRGRPWLEVRRGWPVMVAGALAIGTAMPTLSIYALPYFMHALNQEFGWSRQAIGVAVSCLTLTMFLTSPLVGRLADRFGVRPVAGVSLILFALGLAAMSALSDEIAGLYLAYVGLAVLGAGASHTCYLRAVAGRFDAARGLALGVAGSGAGFWALLAPLFMPGFIATYGWRPAWWLLAAMSLVALPAILFVFREPSPLRTETTTAGAAAGLAAHEARRTRVFWLMLSGVFSLGVGLVGLTVQLIPLVTDVTGSARAAQLAATLFGSGLMCGRLFTGLLLDRASARTVATALFSAPIVGIAAFLSGHAWGPALLGLGLGLAAGAENDILGYLISRYFGFRAFSELFGWMFGALALGAAVGPLLINLLHDIGWGVSPSMMFSATLCAVAAGLYACLGPYPQAAAPDDRPELGKV